MRFLPERFDLIHLRSSQVRCCFCITFITTDQQTLSHNTVSTSNYSTMFFLFPSFLFPCQTHFPPEIFSGSVSLHLFCPVSQQSSCSIHQLFHCSASTTQTSNTSQYLLLYLIRLTRFSVFLIFFYFIYILFSLPSLDITLFFSVLLCLFINIFFCSTGRQLAHHTFLSRTSV